MAKEETTTTTCTCGGRCICNSKHRVLYALGGLVILGLLLGTVFACGVKMGQHRQDFGRDGFGRGSMMMRGGFSGDDAAGGPRQMRGGTIGKVTAVSADSLTITGERTGGTTTYKLNDATSITKADGTRAAASDIKTDSTVAVRVSSTDSTTAVSVAIQ